jgi:hypothetical protein
MYRDSLKQRHAPHTRMKRFIDLVRANRLGRERSLMCWLQQRLVCFATWLLTASVQASWLNVLQFLNNGHYNRNMFSRAYEHRINNYIPAKTLLYFVRCGYDFLRRQCTQ